MIISAQDLTRTRNCAAAECEQAAENYSRLCWRCQQREQAGHPIRTATPIPLGNTLRCSKCRLEKPDKAFSSKQNAPTRRFRHHECKTCAKTRRDAARANWTPEQFENERAKQQARQRRLRAELRAIRQLNATTRNLP